MKILFVSGNLCDGGAQRVIAVVASKLAERGHDVHLLLYSRNEKEYPLSSKVNVKVLGSTFQEYSKISAFKRIILVRKYLKELKPQVAVGFLEGGYGLFVSSLGMRFPKIASARIKPDVILKAKGIRGTIDRIWFKHADAVVLQNEEQNKQVPNNLWRNCIVIPNPVSQEALESSAVIQEKVKRIVMVGRLAEQKNYPMIISCMKLIHDSHPEITLDIFGKGKQEQYLNSLINEYGLTDTVNLCGWTQDAIKEYQKSDIYVLSSNYEGMPNALMEAMAVGIPCISTNCETGPSELIENGVNGILVPAQDEKAMYQGLSSLIQLSQDERKKMGLAAKRFIGSQFNENRVAEQWERLFESLVS